MAAHAPRLSPNPLTVSSGFDYPTTAAKNRPRRKTQSFRFVRHCGSAIRLSPSSAAVVGRIVPQAGGFFNRAPSIAQTPFLW